MKRKVIEWVACWGSLLLLGSSHAFATDDGANETSQSNRPAKIFLIGNSLTWDALPSLLGGDVQWHVDCGKSLKHIYDHPHSPCVKSSTAWPTALKRTKYDFLCVQPFSGTTLDEDVAVISSWIALQPTAVLVLHTGWNRAKDFERVYHTTVDHQRMVHTPAYFEALRAELSRRHPRLEIRSTQAIEVLDVVWHDIEGSRAPFDSFSELYRDEIHMTTQVGRYLMHNLMRRTLGQALSTQGFQIEANQRAYLDEKLREL